VGGEPGTYIKKNKETRSVALRDDGIQINTLKTVCACVPCTMNTGKNRNIKDS